MPLFGNKKKTQGDEAVAVEAPDQPAVTSIVPTEDNKVEEPVSRNTGPGEETQVGNFLEDKGLGGLAAGVVEMGFKTIEELTFLRQELCQSATSYPVPQLVQFLGQLDVYSACKLKKVLTEDLGVGEYGGRNSIKLLAAKYATTTEKRVKEEEEKAKADILEGDKQALLACLKENPQWNVRLSWKKSYDDTDDLCSWAGVEGSDRVIKIDLDGKKVEGLIPSALGKLIMLKCIDLSNCKVEGPIPESFKNLINLEELILKGTKIQGPLPQFLQSLPKLKKIVCTYAEEPPDDRAALKAMCEENPQWDERVQWLKALADGDSFAAMKGICGGDRVTEIDLGLQGLLGTIPPSIGKLTGLRKLILKANKIEGPIPGSISKLISLKELDFSMTHIKEEEEATVKAFNLPALDKLQVSYQEEPPSFVW